MTSPKIALVHDFLFTFAGGERVLQALHKLYPEAPIYTTLYEPKVIQQHFPQATIHTSSLQRSPLKGRPSLLLPQYPRAVEEWNFSEYDIVISSSSAFSHGIITGPDTTHICYCHTPMRYAWDWHAENVRERGLEGKWRGIALQKVLSKLRFWDAVTAKRVDHWIANSTTVQERIAKYYRQESTVIYPPVDIQHLALAPKTESAYAVSIGRLTSNKHLDQVITACHAVQLPLKIAGSGKEEATLRALVSKLKANVEFLGPISEEEKRQLLAKASCFIFAAEDDFGIAPVESLASGTPVVALAKGGVCETVQPGKTGILYPEQSTASLEVALRTFQEKGVSASAAEIRESSMRFSYETFASAIQTFVTDHA